MEIDGVVWDRGNTSHMRAHGIAPWEVQSIVESGDWVASTHPDYPGQARITGRTSRGRFLTIALEPTNRPAIWRPVTGWDAAGTEEVYYWQHTR